MNIRAEKYKPYYISLLLKCTVVCSGNFAQIQKLVRFFWLDENIFLKVGKVCEFSPVFKAEVANSQFAVSDKSVAQQSVEIVASTVTFVSFRQISGRDHVDGLHAERM